MNSTNYLRPTDAAEYMSVSLRYLRKLVLTGRLSSFRLGRRAVRFRRVDLDRLMEECRVGKAV